MDTPKERSSQDVTVNGQTWRFVVYERGDYTLIDPEGRPVPPMDYFTRDEIAALLKR